MPLQAHAEAFLPPEVPAIQWIWYGLEFILGMGRGVEGGVQKGEGEKRGEASQEKGQGEKGH